MLKSVKGKSGSLTSQIPMLELGDDINSYILTFLNGKDLLLTEVLCKHFRESLTAVAWNQFDLLGGDDTQSQVGKDVRTRFFRFSKAESLAMLVEDAEETHWHCAGNFGPYHEKRKACDGKKCKLKLPLMEDNYSELASKQGEFEFFLRISRKKGGLMRMWQTFQRELIWQGFVPITKSLDRLILTPGPSFIGCPALNILLEDYERYRNVGDFHKFVAHNSITIVAVHKDTNECICVRSTSGGDVGTIQAAETLESLPQLGLKNHGIGTKPKAAMPHAQETQNPTGLELYLTLVIREDRDTQDITEKKVKFTLRNNLAADRFVGHDQFFSMMANN